MIYTHLQQVAAPVDRVQAFFSDARNLVKVSPRYPVMRIPECHSAIAAGNVLPIGLDFGIVAVTLYSTIEEVGIDGSFRDSFRGFGFRSWCHRHCFKQEARGTTIVDEITCEPQWWLRPFAPLCLRLLFSVRSSALAKEFG
jgi:ligand-binding SRPBCC domain-containing protein